MTKNEIINNINRSIDKAKVEDKYSIFMFDCIKREILDSKKDDFTIEYLYNMLSDWEEKSKLPYNTGVLLNELIEDSSIVPAIHRTYFKYEDINGYKHNNDLDNIMCNGLYNNGHANAVGGTAMLNNIPDVALTMTPLRGITGLINLIGNYKSSNTVVVGAFPKDIVNEELINIEPNKIYDKREFYYIKPQYILGAIIKEKEGLDTFYLKNEILENRYKLDHTK